MIKLRAKGEFDRMYRELVKNNPELRSLVAYQINLFLRNPDDTRLDNHALTGRMQGQWAFSIDSDVRIVYELMGKNTVRFLAIGVHSKVY